MTARAVRPGRVRAAGAVAAAGLLCGLAMVLVALVSPLGGSAIWAVFGPLIGWSFIGAGLFAWLRPPSRRFGALLLITGFTWFLGALTLVDQPLVWTLGLPVGSLWLAVLVQALVSFPGGRRPPAAPRAT